MLFPLIAALLVSTASQDPGAQLRDSGALKDLPKLKQPVSVEVEDCKAPKTTATRVTICERTVEQVTKSLAGVAETEESDARTARARRDGALVALVRHEFGNAAALQQGRPPSDALADQFAAVSLSRSKHAVPAAEARVLLATAPADRDAAATFACLVYGAAPGKHHSLATRGWIPAERVPSCAGEYRSAFGH